MRVVIFSQFFPPEVGAAQTRLESFASELVSAGHDVTVIAEVPNHPKGVIPPEWRGRLVHRSQENGYEVVRVWVSTSARMSAVRRVAWYATYATNAVVVALFAARRRPDVVLATSPPFPVLVAGLVTAAVWRRPFVIDVRDLWPATGIAMGELRGRLLVRSLERLEESLYRRAAAVTCATRSFVDHVVARGAEPAQVHLLPNGTLPALFRPDRRDPDLRARLGLQEGFVVGYVGMLGLAQGLPALLDAAEILSDDERIRFLLVGDGVAKRDLIATAQSRSLRNVTFVDQVPVHQAPAYINACDLLIAPLAPIDLFQNFIPSKIFDYLACGKPVAVMVDGEARRLVEESRTGVFVEPGNGDDLAKTILWLRDEPWRLQEMGARGRPFVESTFDRREIARQLERVLAAVVTRSRAFRRRSRSTTGKDPDEDSGHGFQRVHRASSRT